MSRFSWPLVLATSVAAFVALAIGTTSAKAHPCKLVASVVFKGVEGQHVCGEDFAVDEEDSVAEDTTDIASDPVGPAVASFEYSPNMTPVGFSERAIPGTSLTGINSDLAFQGKYAYQGTYFGFRIIDVSDPANPTQVLNYQDCGNDGQGDVLVYDNILIRSYDAPASATETCGGQLSGSGFEGVHIFDITDKTHPVLLTKIRMATTGSGPILPGGTYTSGCGSHTATLVPDAVRGNLYVYSSGSSGNCTGIDILRIPLANPAGAGIVRRAAALRQCHDTGVIFGDVNLAACAGGDGYSMFSFNPALPPDAAGGLENPTRLYSKPMGIGGGPAHSHAFSYDGDVVIFGWEPGGGTGAQCQTTSAVVNRTIFFMDPLTGGELGRLVQPRPQTNRENCTWHNFNVVPTNRGRIAVIGSYQMGITVLDFTDPAHVQQIAYADPAPLSPTSLVTGGDWSTYWYNGSIFESDIRRGVLVWDLDERKVEGARTFDISNPQTQTVSFDLDKTAPAVSASLTTGGEDNWYREPVVTLSADDGSALDGSGIHSLQYKLDAGDWTAYSGPFEVTGEGEHTLEYRAEDGAANVATKTEVFRIDSIAPEASLVFDSTANKVAVVGSDGGSGISESPGEASAAGSPAGPLATHVVADRAGNTTTLVVENFATSADTAARFSLVSTQYNDGTAVAAPENMAKLAWTLSKKTGQAIHLDQLLRVVYGTGKAKTEFETEANFDGGGSGTPATNVKRRTPTGTTRSTEPGLYLIALTTDKGNVSIEP